MFLLQLLSPWVLVCNNRQAPPDEVIIEPEVNIETYLYSVVLKTAEPRVIFQQGPIKVTAHCLADQEAEIKVELHDLDREGMYFSKVIRSSDEEDMTNSEVITSFRDSKIGVVPVDGMHEEVLWRENDDLTGGAIATSTHRLLAWGKASFGFQENSEQDVKCALKGAFSYGIPN